MKKFTKFVVGTAVAAAAGACVYKYLSDKKAAEADDFDFDDDDFLDDDDEEDEDEESDDAEQSDDEVAKEALEKAAAAVEDEE